MGSCFTIGHSNRAIGNFVSLLREAGITLLVDVRTVPRSRYNPQFNGDALARILAAGEIGYRHSPALGGLRGKIREDSPNGFWKEGGFRNFADYALTPAFAAALEGLRVLEADHACAIMCAEADWRHCHRQIITDYLLAAGDTVRHIVAPGRTEEARLTPQAVTQADGTLLYPPETLPLGF